MRDPGEDIKVLRPGDIRRIPDRHALIIAGNAPPIIAQLTRCLDGKTGKQLATELEQARARVNATRADASSAADRGAAALRYARSHRLTPHETGDEPIGTDDEPAKRGWSW